MRYSRTMNQRAWLRTVLSAIFLNFCRSLNTKLLETEKNQLSDVMKEFMSYVIEKHSNEKDGFLQVLINKIDPEFTDFTTKTLNKNGGVIVINFHIDREVQPLLNPNHFKFVLTDPEGDLSHAETAFKKVRISRAKIVLILTKRPLPIFVKYVLDSYWRIKCFNVILAYESDGKVEVLTHNPYLPTASKLVNLTSTKYTQDLFFDKSRNLHGSKINCLLTHDDRTKIKKIKNSNGEIHFEGKDYQAIETIISHLNGRLQMETMDNIIYNPWFESIYVDNRTNRKISILKKRDISILIKSERFTPDDDILDNLYPHTQNDLSCLAPKSSLISVTKAMFTVFSPITLIIISSIPSLFSLVIIALRKLSRQNLETLDVCFSVARIAIVNSLTIFPKITLERFLFFGFLIHSFVLNTCFQSKITSILAIRNYYPEINTIEQLFSSGLPLYSIPNYIEEVEKKYFGTKYEDYAKSLITLSTNEGLMDQMIYRSDVSQIPAFLTEHDIAVYVSRCRYLRKNGAQMYHLVQESLIPNYQSYKVVHNSPLLTIFNKKLRRLEEGGFIDLWATRTIFNATMEGFLFPEDYNEMEHAKPLSLDIAKLWMYCLFSGYVLSLTVFVAEMMVYKKFQSPKFPFLN